MTITEQTTLAELELHAARHGVTSIALSSLTIAGTVYITAVLETAHHKPATARGKTVAEAIAAAFEHLYQYIGKDIARALPS
jgi:hypothetical protein